MVRQKSFVFIVVALIIIGNPILSAKKKKKDVFVPKVTDYRMNQGQKVVAAGKRGMVATQTYLTTMIAVEVLKSGGNAVDAFITAVLYQHVTEPHMVGHFGIMSGLYYDAATGKYHHFDAMGERPLASRSDKGDPMKVSIGGTVKGLEALWKRYGTKEWSSYLKPAIKAAEEGVLVTSYMHSVIYAAWENTQASWPDGVRDLINNKEARDFYKPNGFIVPVGKRWKMPTLATHLKKLAKNGADYLYTGEWGQKFVKEANKLGGRVSIKDMADYKVRWSEPLSYTYRGNRIITEPVPIIGGLMVAGNMNVLENFDIKKIGHFSKTADTLEIMVKANARVFADISWVGDPLSFRNPSDLMLSNVYGKVIAEFIRNTEILPEEDSAHNKSSSEKLNVSNYADGNTWRKSYDSNHNIIVDNNGNWICSLHSGHGGCPGVFIDGVEANGSDVPSYSEGKGRRLLAHLAATIIEKDGQPWMALGTPGFPPQPVTQVLVNLIDFKMNPKEAADAPRFFSHSKNGRSINIESRIDESIRKKMKQRGFNIVDLTEYNWHCGSFQIVWKDTKTGKYYGVSDPRRLGYAEGY